VKGGGGGGEVEEVEARRAFAVVALGATTMARRAAGDGECDCDDAGVAVLRWRCIVAIAIRRIGRARAPRVRRFVAGENEEREGELFRAERGPCMWMV
jgi:hypothetical protein